MTPRSFLPLAATRLLVPSSTTGAPRLTSTSAWRHGGGTVCLPAPPHTPSISRAGIALPGNSRYRSFLRARYQTARRALPKRDCIQTVAALDRIVVLEGGAIVGDGAHAELSQAGGAHESLWDRQTGAFLEAE